MARLINVRSASPVTAIADFAVSYPGTSIPAGAIRAANRGILDYFGVSVAGSVDPAMEPLVEYVARTFQSGPATVLGLAHKKVPQAAAWVNGAAGHILDFDDMSEPMGGHPSVVILPTAIALAEAGEHNYRAVAEAYVIGVEVAAMLGRSLHPTHYERGWHPTATLGIFGATAAAARLLGLSVDATRIAVGIAASMASGIKGNFGTLMKPSQVGLAASHGIAAAELARLGATASSEILTGTHSFSAVFNGDPSRTIDWSPLDSLGRNWAVEAPGLVFKLYPCCGSTHAPIDAMLGVRARDHIDPDAIEHIDVYVHPRRLPHTDRPNPLTGLEAKFSVQYAVAVAAQRGNVVMADFTDDAVHDPSIRKLLGKVATHNLPPEEQFVLPGQHDCFAAAIRVLAGGNLHSYRVGAPQGFDMSMPITDERLDDKFVATASIGLGMEQSRILRSTLQSWFDEKVGLADVMACLRTPNTLLG